MKGKKNRNDANYERSKTPRHVFLFGTELGPTLLPSFVPTLISFSYIDLIHHVTRNYRKAFISSTFINTTIISFHNIFTLLFSSPSCIYSNNIHHQSHGFEI